MAKRPINIIYVAFHYILPHPNDVRRHKLQSNLTTLGSLAKLIIVYRWFICNTFLTMGRVLVFVQVAALRAARTSTRPHADRRRKGADGSGVAR